MKCSKAKGDDFSQGYLTPYGNIELNPSAGGLYEGLKANRTEDGRFLLFRPELNALRMKMGAERLCMPSPSTQQFIDSIKQTVLANKRWVGGKLGQDAKCKAGLVFICKTIRHKHSSRQALKKLHALLSRSRMGAIAFAPTAASYFLLFSTKILCRNGRLSMISYISLLPHTFLFAKDKPQQNN
ncbi:unnamed protein product [Prunus armeniaca]